MRTLNTHEQLLATWWTPEGFSQAPEPKPYTAMTHLNCADFSMTKFLKCLLFGHKVVALGMTDHSNEKNKPDNPSKSNRLGGGTTT